jgi:hypothetical protein
VLKNGKELSLILLFRLLHTPQQQCCVKYKKKEKKNIFLTFPGLLKYFKRKLLACDRTPPTAVTTMVCGCYLELHLYYFIFGGKKNLGYIRNDVIATNNN